MKINREKIQEAVDSLFPEYPSISEGWTYDKLMMLEKAIHHRFILRQDHQKHLVLQVNRNTLVEIDWQEEAEKFYVTVATWTDSAPSFTQFDL